MIIAIDGPVASGKSTISRMLAKRLGYYYLCTGLLYRALSYLLINKFNYTVETIAHPLMEDVKACFDEQSFVYHYDEQTQEHIFFDTHDITPYLKDTLIDKASSIISVNKQVRSVIVDIQRDIAARHNIVTDGRDVGSVVFPHAEFKFFVTASVETRAQRWRKDQEKYGNFLSLDQAITLITDRDDRDKNRDIAPLIVARGAIVIDTTDLGIEQAVDMIMSYITVG